MCLIPSWIKAKECNQWHRIVGKFRRNETGFKLVTTQVHSSHTCLRCFPMHFNGKKMSNAFQREENVHCIQWEEENGRGCYRIEDFNICFFALERVNRLTAGPWPRHCSTVQSNRSDHHLTSIHFPFTIMNNLPVCGRSFPFACSHYPSTQNMEDEVVFRSVSFSAVCLDFVSIMSNVSYMIQFRNFWQKSNSLHSRLHNTLLGSLL